MKLATAPAQKPPEKPKTPKGDQLPLARRLEHEVDRTLTKLGKLGARLAQIDDPNATKAAEEITNILAEQGVRAFTQQVPDGATKRKGEKKPSPITVGSVVDVREKRIGKYTDLLTADEMKGLKVVMVKGNKLLCETAGGIRVFLPRGDTQAKK